MPTHNVDDAFDPSFWDQFTVRRLVETIDQHGRVVLQFTMIQAQGVVVAASPNDLQRVPDEQWMNKSITIYSQFRLQGPVKDQVMGRTQPDEVIWHGSRFVVSSLEDYSGYGRGFVVVVCTSIEAIDGAPLADPRAPPLATTRGNA